MALSCYLEQLKDPQVSIAVKQHHPTSVGEAISSTIEMEAYLCKSAASTQSQHVSVAAPVTKESEDVIFVVAAIQSTQRDLLGMMQQLVQ